MPNGSWYKRRNDFFVVKNYDVTMLQHKVKIDSFIVNYLKTNTFLEDNNNSFLRLTFFNYGDGIDEHTTHQFDTDYTIHNLFSYKKEIAVAYFDTKVGYGGSHYNITTDEVITSKRNIISNYFKSLDLKLDK